MRKIAIAVAASLALPVLADDAPAEGKVAQKVQVSQPPGGVDKGASRMAPKKKASGTVPVAAEKSIKDAPVKVQVK